METGIIPLETILSGLIKRPREIFDLPGGKIEPGAPADLAILNFHAPHIIDPDHFLSMGRATPFAGESVSAAVEMTFHDGELVYHRKEMHR